MSTVAMLFILPIGIAFLMYERRYQKSYDKVFEDFFLSMCQDKSLNAPERLLRVQKMLEKNHYHIVQKKQSVSWQKQNFLAWVHFL